MYGQKVSAAMVRKRRSNPWPPRSHDVTPLDFFLRRYVKDDIYKSNARDNNIDSNFKIRKVICASSVSEKMLKNT